MTTAKRTRYYKGAPGGPTLSPNERTDMAAIVFLTSLVRACLCWNPGRQIYKGRTFAYD